MAFPRATGRRPTLPWLVLACLAACGGPTATGPDPGGPAPDAGADALHDAVDDAPAPDPAPPADLPGDPGPPDTPAPGDDAPSAPDDAPPVPDDAPAGDPGPPDAPPPDEGPPPPAHPVQDIVATDLWLDLGARAGRATVVAWPADGSGEVVLDVHGLTLLMVAVDGVEVEPAVAEGRLHAPAAPGDGPAVIEVAYAFPGRTLTQFDGWIHTRGSTILWPDHCGNLFPCDPSPADGVTFTMEVTGWDPDLSAVYPASTFTDAPPYMPAVAVGDFARLDLGTTASGLAVSAWYVPGSEVDEAAARAGTAHLVAFYGFLESTCGPYPFGPEAGTVQVDWGAKGLGGMEHHPFVHVAASDFAVEEVQVHEAAHAWFGNGVRIACWEDFVLSEGTTTYLAARGLAAVGGPDLWPDYLPYLDDLCTGADVNTVALPGTCGAIRLEDHPLWSMVPYMKGACFFAEAARLLGVDVLDGVLGDFYRARVNGAARMGDLVDALAARTPEEDLPALDGLVADWLLVEACPEGYAERCVPQAR